jgi:hypothetical protein
MTTTTAKRQASEALREIIAAARKYIQAEQVLVEGLRAEKQAEPNPAMGLQSKSTTKGVPSCP